MTLILLCISIVLAQAGTQEPVPPRTGLYSVQLIIGDTDDVILNIIPPRLYTDGTPIPKGTPCTIIISRSKAKGALGTYTEEVGRAEGAVTAPNDLQAWMVVKANAGPDDPLNDVIYLACTAVVGGVESAQNNQWLTINWHAQGIPEWDVVEFPGGAGAAAVGIMPCSNYWGPIEPTGTEAAGPRQSPGKYILVYAEVPKSSDPSQSLPANWNWKNFGPIDLNGGKRYFLVFGRSSDPEIFEEQNLPIEETLVTATRDTAIIWDSNKATSDVRYAYCLQPELVGPVAKSPLTNNYSGEAISERSGKTWPFKLTLIGPDMNSSISGQIEWPSLDSIHQIVGSKTTTGITFTETADIKKGGAVLNCKYYLNSEGNSLTGTWDSCDDGDYGTISMKTQ